MFNIRNFDIKNKINYFYTCKIKKWMFCPACNIGKMKLYNSVWKCEKCNYELSNYEFSDNYIFWFCDECNAYLNNQTGFDSTSNKYICTKCGYENDISINNVKGFCIDCNKTLDDINARLCPECKEKRNIKTIKNLELISDVLNSTSDSLEIIKDNYNTFEDKKYSTEWIKSVSDTILKEEYEKIKLAYYSDELNYETANILQDLISRFDDEMEFRSI